MLANELICKAMTKSLYGNSEKSFLEWEKMTLKKHFPELFPREYFHVCVIGKQSYGFEFNLELIYMIEFFKKLSEISRTASASAISAFRKTHKCKLNPKTV